MPRANWKRLTNGDYVCQHRTVVFNGEVLPEFIIRRDPQTGRWVTFMFLKHLGDYTIIKGLSEGTLKEAIHFIDVESIY
jgi:hypothetical protein